MAELTTCEQAAIDLQTYKDALAALLTGKRVVDLQHADKRIGYYAAGNVSELTNLIRLKQAEVDACNGVRGRRSVLRIIPDWPC